MPILIRRKLIHQFQLHHQTQEQLLCMEELQRALITTTIQCEIVGKAVQAEYIHQIVLIA